MEHGSKASVLFHINQVWTGGEDAVPLTSVISRLLTTCLPLGSQVRAIVTNQVTGFNVWTNDR